MFFFDVVCILFMFCDVNIVGMCRISYSFFENSFKSSLTENLPSLKILPISQALTGTAFLSSPTGGCELGVVAYDSENFFKFKQL